MLRFTYLLVTCGLIACVWVATEGHAYAYVDPGTGLYLLQGMSSVFAGVLFYFRKRLKGILRRSRPAEAELHDRSKG